MVVAPRTADRQPQHGSTDCRYHIVKLVAAFRFLRHERVERRGRVESRGSNGHRMISGQFVAGNLPANESIVGQVDVHRPNDEVAIRERMWTHFVFFVAVAICITSQVEPNSPPPFSKAGIQQQAIDVPLVSGLVGGRRKRGDLLECRR